MNESLSERYRPSLKRGLTSIRKFTISSKQSVPEEEIVDKKRGGKELWDIVRKKRMQVMPSLRLRQRRNKTPPLMLNPQSRFKVSWDGFITLMVFYITIMIPYRVGFNQEASTAIFVFEILSDGIFFIDIIFKVTFHES